uniref:Ammonium transporter AmtB-like domain-containing protein n=1 Tax=Hucho hucho TaxID=62062 RepID=A0A4W5NY25_9TELE
STLQLFCNYCLHNTTVDCSYCTFTAVSKLSTDGKIHLGVINLLNAEFACAVVLISFGAVLGKTSPVQLLVMALQQVPIFAVTEWAVLKYLKINDADGSILIHLFACYFGLGVTFVLYRPSLNDGQVKEITSYQSDILSVMGTLFLWVFLLSFNSALTLKGDDQHRAILHTFIGLSSSTMTAFALSAVFNKRGKLTMADIQNVTAAYALGIMGCNACFMGYRYLTPFLARRFRIQDQCGIHNLNSLAGPHILHETYGPSMYQIFAHSYKSPVWGHWLLLILACHCYTIICFVNFARWQFQICALFYRVDVRVRNKVLYSKMLSEEFTQVTTVF